MPVGMNTTEVRVYSDAGNLQQNMTRIKSIWRTKLMIAAFSLFGN